MATSGRKKSNQSKSRREKATSSPSIVTELCAAFHQWLLSSSRRKVQKDAPVVRSPVLHDDESTELDAAVNILLSGKNSAATCRPPPTCSSLSHVQQRERWDCGLACLEMVMQWVDQHNSSHQQHTVIVDDYYKWMIDHVKTESVWTVDLVILLDELLLGPRANYLFVSTCMSVNNELHDLEYYEKAFCHDCIRVEALFDRIRTHSLPAVQTSRLSLQTVQDVVQRDDCVAIALVDNSILTRPRKQQQRPYAGHYIVLAGVTRDAKHLKKANEAQRDVCFVIYNPAVGGPLYLSLGDFERAWRAEGTDEDIIFVAVLSG